MPIVSPDLALRDEVLEIRRAHDWTEAELSRRLGVKAMTINRFLKSGRAMPQTLEHIRRQVASRRREVRFETPSVITLSSHVVAALEFLLAASREKASQGEI